MNDRDVVEFRLSILRRETMSRSVQSRDEHDLEVVEQTIRDAQLACQRRYEAEL